MRGGLVSRTKLNQIEDAINDHGALHGCDGLVVVDGNGIKINLGELISRLPKAGAVRRAAAQGNAPAHPQLTVRLVDANGVCYGDEFNVENIQGENWDDIVPRIAADDLLLITQADDGVWYGMGFWYPPVVRRAKAQENAPAAAVLSVKLVDGEGAVIGDPFNVSNIEGQNWNGMFPLIVSGDLLLITRTDGICYGLGFSYVGACA